MSVEDVALVDVVTAFPVSSQAVAIIAPALEAAIRVDAPLLAVSVVVRALVDVQARAVVAAAQLESDPTFTREAPRSVVTELLAMCVLVPALVDVVALSSVSLLVALAALAPELSRYVHAHLLAAAVCALGALINVLTRATVWSQSVAVAALADEA